MPVICFEGPSAVGKSTTAIAFAKMQNAFVIPEVNELFDRPENAPPDWYLERQVDRWTSAAEHSRRGKLVVLDGDPFQPFWYNWVFESEGWKDTAELEAFYRPILERGDMGIPDLYIVLVADVAALWERKGSDLARQRSNFERHLRLIKPQARYFETLQRRYPDRVRFLTATVIDENVRNITTMISGLTTRGEPAIEIFDYLVHWLRGHTA